jgi:hypothetical protein
MVAEEAEDSEEDLMELQTLAVAVAAAMTEEMVAMVDQELSLYDT